MEQLSPKRGYLVVPNFYAPKCSRYIQGDSPERIHALSYSQCNFHCNYCNFHERKLHTTYIDCSDPDFLETKLRSMLPSGHSFKFTGGEPTLNPYLERDLQIVRKLGGTIYLDSNCSRREVMQRLLSQDLVDVLGVSLKGLTQEEALQRSQVNDPALCWEHVWSTVEAAARSPRTEVIITYVCTEGFTLEKLRAFSALLAPYPNLYLKINNYQADNGLAGCPHQPCDPEELSAIVSTFVQEAPQWTGRIILIPGSAAVQNFSRIRFF